MLTIPELQEARKPRNLFKPCNCPHCGSGLKERAAVVIATRNCPQCGRHAVAEPENNDAPPPFTAKQIDAAHDAFTRFQSRIAWCVLVGFVIFMAGGFVAALYRDTIHDAVRPVMDPSWLGILVLFALFAGFLFIAGLALLAERASPKCPHCKAVIQRLADLARLTGNCCACGRRLVEPPANEPVGSFPTVEEFDAANKRLARSVNVTGLILMTTPWLLLVAGVAVVASLNPEQCWRALEDRYGAMNAALALTGIGIAVAVIAAVLAIAMLRWFERWTKKNAEADPLLNCPHCKAGLLAASYVIASKRCPECRKRVLADPEPEPAAGS